MRTSGEVVKLLLLLNATVSSCAVYRPTYQRIQFFDHAFGIMSQNQCSRIA